MSNPVGCACAIKRTILLASFNIYVCLKGYLCRNNNYSGVFFLICRSVHMKGGKYLNNNVCIECFSAGMSAPADKKIKMASVAVEQPGQPGKVLLDTVADGLEVSTS